MARARLVSQGREARLLLTPGPRAGPKQGESAGLALAEAEKERWAAGGGKLGRGGGGGNGAGARGTELGQKLGRGGSFFFLIQNLFQIHFKICLKIFLHFSQLTQHNKINSLHECTNKLLSFMINFILMKNIIFLYFMSTKFHN